MVYDYVIIGSGLGGLECGYILAKEGFSVCVLEKNRQSIVQNPPVIPAHTYKRGQQTAQQNENSRLQQLLLNPCKISKELSQIIESCDFTSPKVRTEAITLASANSGN